MVNRCVVPGCSLEGDFSEYFHFPQDLNLQDRWISRLPLLDFTSLNFKEAVICEHHFNPKEVKDGPGFTKKLMENSVPEYIPTHKEINSDSCRFCLDIIEGKKFRLNELIKTHYQSLMQEEMNTCFHQKFSCEKCFIAIRNSAYIKSKIQENQIKLMQIGLPTEFLEIKVETCHFDDEQEMKPTVEFEEIRVEANDEIDVCSQVKKRSYRKKKEKHR